jgi:outer membrane murein-binding lipoprotein Lpp
VEAANSRESLTGKSEGDRCLDDVATLLAKYSTKYDRLEQCVQAALADLQAREDSVNNIESELTACNKFIDRLKWEAQLLKDGITRKDSLEKTY